MVIFPSWQQLLADIGPILSVFPNCVAKAAASAARYWPIVAICLMAPHLGYCSVEVAGLEE